MHFHFLFQHSVSVLKLNLLPRKHFGSSIFLCHTKHILQILLNSAYFSWNSERVREKFQKNVSWWITLQRMGEEGSPIIIIKNWSSRENLRYRSVFVQSVFLRNIPHACVYGNTSIFDGLVTFWRNISLFKLAPCIWVETLISSVSFFHISSFLKYSFLQHKQSTNVNREPE